LWQDEKAKLEREINSLKRSSKSKIKEESEEEEELVTDRSINSFRSLGNTGTVLRGVNYRVTRVNDLGVPELKQQLQDQQKRVCYSLNYLYLNLSITS
jgi:Tfp pilus assembly pilus retraction ATPase PilT